MPIYPINSKRNLCQNRTEITGSIDSALDFKRHVECVLMNNRKNTCGFIKTFDLFEIDIREIP